MSSIAEGITIEGEPSEASESVNSESGFAAAMAAKAAAQSQEQAAPAERRSAPVTPDRDRADLIREQLLGTEGSTRVSDGITEHEPGEASARREEIARVARAREQAATDPEVQALAEGDELATADAAELAERRRSEAVEEHLVTLEESDEMQERAEAWQALSAEERHEAEDLGYVTDADAFELSFAARVWSEQIERDKSERRAEKLAWEDNEARANALDKWATSRGLEGAALEDRMQAVAEFVRSSGAEIGGLDAGRWADLWTKADRALIERDRADRETAFKNDLLGQSTSVGDGIEVLGANGQWVAPNAVQLAPRPSWANVEHGPRKRQSAAQVRAAVAQESPLAAEYQKLQREAEKQFAKTAAKD